MKTTKSVSAVAACASLLLLSACGGAIASDGSESETDTDVAAEPGAGSAFGSATDPETGAEFAVEVRYVGGATREDAELLLASLEVSPARELFPGVDLSGVAGDAGELSPLDASEPTFQVVLRGQNAAAEKEPFAWRSTAQLSREGARAGEPADGVSTSRQALSLSGSVHEYLSAGETWKTNRMYCHAFTFGAEIVGVAKVCADLGYKGTAGSICSTAIDPRSPVIVAHPGPDINPLNEHYFHGRVVASGLFGVPAPAEMLAAGWACL